MGLLATEYTRQYCAKRNVFSMWVVMQILFSTSATHSGARQEVATQASFPRRYHQLSSEVRANFCLPRRVVRSIFIRVSLPSLIVSCRTI